MKLVPRGLQLYRCSETTEDSGDGDKGFGYLGHSRNGQFHIYLGSLPYHHVLIDVPQAVGLLHSQESPIPRKPQPSIEDFKQTCPGFVTQGGTIFIILDIKYSLCSRK